MAGMADVVNSPVSDLQRSFEDDSWIIGCDSWAVGAVRETVGAETGLEVAIQGSVDGSVKVQVL